MQAPGAIDQQHVGAAGAGFGEGVEGEAGGVGFVAAGDDVAAGALAPDLELFDGGGAEGVAGDEHGFHALFGVELRQFADGGGFAGAVDADDEHDMRLERAVDDQRLRDWGEDGGDFVGQRQFDFVFPHFLAEAAAAEVGDYLGGDGGAEIGGDQQVFQFFQRGVIQAALGEHRADGGGEFFAGAGKTLFEPGEKAAERHYIASAIKPAALVATTRARRS